VRYCCVPPPGVHHGKLLLRWLWLRLAGTAVHRSKWPCAYAVPQRRTQYEAPRRPSMRALVVSHAAPHHQHQEHL